MKLPNNSLGVSDANQWHDCPKLFVESMQRHVLQPGEREASLISKNSHILSYGSAVHDACCATVLDPDIYLDDAVDLAWAKWSPYLRPEHHKEMRKDVAEAILRSRQAKNLELVAAEEDMAVPVFVGRSAKDGAAADEEGGEWYNYRFRIDALYRKKDDPSHYVIRDFKTVRRERFQSEVDEDMQFSGYDVGVRAAFPDAKEVTIWYDQLKFKPVFSSRTEEDRVDFMNWIQSTIIAVLDKRVEDASAEFKLNQWCSYCPLLESCGVVQYASDLAISQIAQKQGEFARGVQLADPYVELYEDAKNAIKALKGYTDLVGDFLKENEGHYAGRVYSVSSVATPKWNAVDAYEIVGDALLPKLPALSKSTMEEFLANPEYSEALMALRRNDGHRRLNSRKAKEKK